VLAQRRLSEFAELLEFILGFLPHWEGLCSSSSRSCSMRLASGIGTGTAPRSRRKRQSLLARLGQFAAGLVGLLAVLVSRRSHRSFSFAADSSPARVCLGGQEAGDVPEQERRVGAGGDQRLAAGSEGDALDAAAVSRSDGQGRCRWRLPTGRPLLRGWRPTDAFRPARRSC